MPDKHESHEKNLRAMDAADGWLFEVSDCSCGTTLVDAWSTRGQSSTEDNREHER